MAITQRLTLEEFLRLPEEKPALEYWRGEVLQKVSPRAPHGALQFGFGRRIDDVPALRRLVRVFTETRVSFAGESVVPDLVVYRRDRFQRAPDGRVALNFTVPPDIALEIFSPGESWPKIVERCRWYAANGVALAIAAHPFRRVVRLFRAGYDSGDLGGSEPLDLGDVLPGFVLTADEFFAPLEADWE
jgi:Uma2 family endonuclease